MDIRKIQERLKEVGFYKGAVDGIAGPLTDSAIRNFQSKNGLQPDGDVGPRTIAVLFPTPVQTVPAADAGGFDVGSMKNLDRAHPLLRSVLIAARKEIVFRVLDSTRGEKAQNEAFRTGRSKARFGSSAHNYTPSIAVDLFPAPYDWNNIPAFDRLARVVMLIAKNTGVPLRWGGDWNMDGDKTKSDAWDKPHFELHPWREYAKSSKLVRP